MEKIKAVRELINAMGGVSHDLDEALKIGAVAIMDGMIKTGKNEAHITITAKAEAVNDENAKTEQKPAKPKSPAKKKEAKRKPFDVGKAMACRRAGWSYSKIAEELDCTEQTVRNNLKKAGFE